MAKKRKTPNSRKATAGQTSDAPVGSLSAAGYSHLLKEIKARIQQARTRAMFSANAEMILLYWDIGRLIDDRQRREGWGAGVIPRLARELHNELPEEKGYSERNIKRMLAFYRAYPEPYAIMPRAVAQLTIDARAAKVTAVREDSEDSILWLIPWGHHAVLMEKLDDLHVRLWYMEQTLANGWSRDVLSLMVTSDLHRRQGNAVTNFERNLPAPQSDLARQILKDPYLFDFITLDEPFRERELETGLVGHLERFLIELGQGFAFVGRQYRLEVADKDFYIDLLFYHLKLRAFIVIELKTGPFRPEYAGKLNFYCNVVNQMLRHPSDQPTIGLILCQGKDRVLAEYSLSGIDKPIGVSSYELTRALPSSLRSVLPTIEEIEAELDELTPGSTDAMEAATHQAVQEPARRTRKQAAKRPPKKK